MNFSFDKVKSRALLIYRAVGMLCYVPPRAQRAWWGKRVEIYRRAIRKRVAGSHDTFFSVVGSKSPRHKNRAVATSLPDLKSRGGGDVRRRGIKGVGEIAAAHRTDFYSIPADRDSCFEGQGKEHLAVASRHAGLVGQWAIVRAQHFRFDISSRHGLIA